MRLLKMFFKSDVDAVRDQIKTDVDNSARRRESATNRFEQTVREVLEINDRLTGRKNEKSF